MGISVRKNSNELPNWIKQKQKLIANIAWKSPGSLQPAMINISRGQRNNYTNPRIYGTAKISEKVFAKQFKPKNSWNTRFLYRGVKLGGGKLRNVHGYSSWSTNIEVAKKFSNGTVLRIPTNLLKGVPVIHYNNNEKEYVLPPMKLIYNSVNNSFVPVRNIVINQRWAPPGHKSMIPRMAARRLL